MEIHTQTSNIIAGPVTKLNVCASNKFAGWHKRRCNIAEHYYARARESRKHTRACARLHNAHNWATMACRQRFETRLSVLCCGREQAQWTCCPSMPSMGGLWSWTGKVLAVLYAVILQCNFALSILLDTPSVRCSLSCSMAIECMLWRFKRWLLRPIGWSRFSQCNTFCAVVIGAFKWNCPCRSIRKCAYERTCAHNEAHTNSLVRLLAIASKFWQDDARLWHAKSYSRNVHGRYLSQSKTTVWRGSRRGIRLQKLDWAWPSAHRFWR